MATVKLTVELAVVVMAVLVVGVKTITVQQELEEAQERIEIEAPEPQLVVVRSGSNVTLSCSASHPWFLCLWVHPAGEKLCSIREDGGTHSEVCQGLEGASLVAGHSHCHVHLQNVGEEDSGDWLCLLSQEGVYHTDRAVTTLSVATPSRPSLQPPGPLFHGEPVSVNCGASRGFPQPEFSWALLDREGGESRDLETAVVWGDLNSSLTFTPALSDSGLVLVCFTRQLDLTTNTLLYSHNSSTTLSVSLRPSPLQAYLEQQQDVVAGVVISCFLLLFCVGLVIVFTVRSNKKARAPPQSSEAGQDSYVIFVSSEEPGITDTRSDKESGIDVSHGDFVSFSSSDLYTTNTTTDRSSSLASQKSNSEPDQDQSIDESGGSEGGLSNISSVFDCQHGCFGHDNHGHHLHHHQPHCNYLRGNVLNTDL